MQGLVFYLVSMKKLYCIIGSHGQNDLVKDILMLMFSDSGAKGSALMTSV